jgi:hypothetical protein
MNRRPLILKISATVTGLCGLYAGYRVFRFLQLSQMRFTRLSELATLSTATLLVEGEVQPLAQPAPSPLCQVETLKTYGFKGTVLRTNYARKLVSPRQEPFKLVSSEGEVTVIPNNNTKIKCFKPSTKHDLFDVSFTKSIEIILLIIISALIGRNNVDVGISEKVSKRVVRAGQRAIVHGDFVNTEKGRIIADFIGSSKETYLKVAEENMVFALVVLGISASITGIIMYAYAEKEKRVEPEEDEIPEGLGCTICLSRKRNVLFWPCNHLFVCESCMKSLTSCPICRKRIQYYYKITY